MDAFDITASALTAQRLRMDVISSNLANVNTTRKADGSVGGYHRKNVVFSATLEQASSNRYGLPDSKVAKSRSINMFPATHGLSIGPDGGPMLSAGVTLREQGGGAGVHVLQIAEDNKTPMKMVYDPSHPDANKEGYVEMPNVNVVSEMVDMISASRAYEANVTAMQSVKGMTQAAMEI